MSRVDAEASGSKIVLAADPAMLGDRPLVEVFPLIADTGYRAVELSPRPDFLPGGAEPRASSSAIDETGNAARSCGIDIVSVMVVYNWSSPDEPERVAAVRYWRQAIEVASDLGCTRVNTELAGDPLRPRESEAAFRRSVDELTPALERSNLRVFIEPHPYDFIESGKEAIHLLASLPPARFGYIYCAPHTFYLGGSLREQVTAGGDLLGHVHLADTFNPARIIVNPSAAAPRIRVHQHLDIGQGEVRWSDLFSALKQVGFAGVMTVSVFAWPDRAVDSLRNNLATVRQLASEAGLDLGG